MIDNSDAFNKSLIHSNFGRTYKNSQFICSAKSENMTSAVYTLYDTLSLYTPGFKLAYRRDAMAGWFIFKTGARLKVRTRTSLVIHNACHNTTDATTQWSTLFNIFFVYLDGISSDLILQSNLVK